MESPVSRGSSVLSIEVKGYKTMNWRQMDPFPRLPFLLFKACGSFEEIYECADFEDLVERWKPGAKCERQGTSHGVTQVDDVYTSSKKS